MTACKNQTRYPLQAEKHFITLPVKSALLPDVWTFGNLGFIGALPALALYKKYSEQKHQRKNSQEFFHRQDISGLQMPDS
jgi:hypothetical protein